MLNPFEDEYKMNVDDDDEEYVIGVDDEYDMGFDDDEDEDYEDYPDGVELDSLDAIVVKISEYVEREKINPVQLRQILFEEKLRELAKARGLGFEDLILSSSPSDEGYNTLIVALYPSLEKYLNKAMNEKNRPILISLLNQALNELMEQGSEKVVEKEELESEPEVDMAVVNAIVNDVMKVYDRLYQPLFINKPMGVLTSQGILSVDKNGKPYLLKSDLSSLKLLYGAFEKFTKGYIKHKDTVYENLNSSFFNSHGDLVYSYCPVYHALNIFGFYEENGEMKQESNWIRFRMKLQQSVTRKIVGALKQVDKGFDLDTIEGSMKELLTNCIIIQDFDRTKVLAMTYRLGVEKLGIDMGAFPNMLVENQKTLLKSEVGELINGSFDNFNIGRVLYAYDADNYNKEILFSYKLFDKMAKSGVKPTTDNLIIGRKLNGEDFGINFSAQNNIVTSIIAGSGSGKGVVTLNILASLLASNAPVVYVDFKPDMAAMLWDLERELGVPIFAVDAKENRHKFGATPVRNPGYGLNAPQGFGFDESFWAIMPYLKTVQLACVAAALRSSDSSLMRDGKLYFIFDELQSMNAQFGEVVKAMEEFIKKNKKDESKADLIKYAEKFLMVFKDNLKSAVTDLLKTSGRNGLVGCIILGQSVNPDDWRFGDQTWKNSPLVRLMTDSNYRLSGAKHKSSKSSYSLDGIKYEGSKFIDDNVMGYFATHANFAPPSDGKAITVVKTYLTLNANDVEQAVPNGDLANPNPNTFVGGLLGNIADMSLRERIYREDLYNPDGTVNERVGFPGLIKAIMNNIHGGTLTEEQLNQDLRETLSRSYKVMMEILQRAGLGHYATLEDYLYDCSIDSIFTYGELKSGVLNANQAVNAEGSEDWLSGSEESVFPSSSVVSQQGALVGVENGLTDDDDDDFDYMPDENAPFTENTLGDTSQYKPEHILQSNQQHKPNVVQPTNIKPSHVQHNVPTNVENAPYISPSKQSGYDGVYDAQMDLPQNPFNLYGRSNRTMSVFNSIRMMSQYIMVEILKVVGDYNRVESFEVTNSGLVINNIAFRPRFSKEVIESMPFDIRQQVANGNIVELFHFENLLKFRNLVVLRIDNVRLAEGRVRREIGLSPSRSWDKLFKKFCSLQELYIGGTRIVDELSAKAYDDNGRGGYTLTETLRKAYNIPKTLFSNSVMERVWDSRPVRVTTGAVGWTLGVKAVTVAATMFGFWGLLFGAFAGYGAYREFKNRRR